ncbi:PIN domain-containing protein [Treponema endosymbiont of Eucomonympha sp.]|uniref:PIN domain-containing protein n=1 Tax=Treponema endosymbiont of Eucomonympha sp. TaxID=1580831 RepID=UPI0007805DA0|nr:PIN domain-containing protein [Treponema endosymbiont of Eucomonympha sp.]
MTNRKLILDTNAVIHFNLADDPEKFNIVANILVENDCLVPIEVIAESVFVLEKSRGMNRKIIADRLKDFIKFQDDLVPDSGVIRYGLNLFATTKFDFIDCILDGYAKINGNPVFTFDKPLKKQLGAKVFNG